LDKTRAPQKISAIVACYGDEPAIPIMYKRLTDVFHKLQVDYEIIYINDNSPDHSYDVLKALAEKDEKLIVINHSRNFGSQSAFTSGMRIASGDAVVLMDGDLQDPPEIIESFYIKWLEGYEVVYGVRVRREAPPFMQFAYKTFYRLFRATAYIQVPVDAGDFSLLDRCVVNALNSLPENNRFIRGLRSWVGFKQTGIPYVRPERMFGRSTNSLLKNIAWARKAIFSFSYMPLNFITWLAILTVGVSVLAIITQVFLRLLFPDIAPQGFTTLILIILFMGSIQILCLGIIGSYLEHIYDEVKRRPPFIVKSFFNYPPGRSSSKDDPDVNRH
jgi:glycosyltransferase involved in cell wall biosynthesis